LPGSTLNSALRGEPWEKRGRVAADGTSAGADGKIDKRLKGEERLQNLFEIQISLRTRKGRSKTRKKGKEKGENEYFSWCKIWLKPR